MDARLGTATVLVGAGLLAGCSVNSDHDAFDDSATAVRAGDPDYALTQLRHGPVGDYGVLPTSLAESLPNHRLRLRGTEDVASFSDALVVGTVTQVTKGNGVIWRDEDDYTTVGYDDPSADTRTAVVTMTIDDATGDIAPGTGSMSFRVLSPFRADPDRFAEGLAGLGRIAVVLDRDPSKVESTPWRTIMDDRLIGVVAADGSLTLPALPHGSSFAGDIHTADQLLAAARGPVTTESVTGP